MGSLSLYALVDGNNFYVSGERVFRPDWVGRSVVVLLGRVLGSAGRLPGGCRRFDPHLVSHGARGAERLLAPVDTTRGAADRTPAQVGGCVAAGWEWRFFQAPRLPIVVVMSRRRTTPLTCGPPIFRSERSRGWCSTAVRVAVCALGILPGTTIGAQRADFGSLSVLAVVRQVADGVLASNDHHRRSFVLADKVGARIYVLSADGRLQGSAAVLIGLAIGDRAAADIGERSLDRIEPQDRKRTLSQVTPFDLLVILLLSESVGNGLKGDDSSVPGGLISAATLVLLNAVLGFITSRSRKLEDLIEGTALIRKDGAILSDALRRHRIGEGDMQKSLREADCTQEQMDRAYLEADGTISVIKRRC